MTDAVLTWKSQLMEYDPTSDVWKEAALRMRQYATDFVDGLKQRPNDTRAVDEVRSLVPNDLREELEALPVAQFALGLIFYRPFQEFDRVYRHFSHEYAKELSMQARKDYSEFDTTSFVYGEVLFFPFADILLSISDDIPHGNGIFYDLGSGIGKAVVAAALVHKFHKAIGIEQLKPLVDFSHARVDKLMEFNDMAGQTISYICGSFFDHNWSDGDVVFCHSTCFSPRQDQQLTKTSRLVDVACGSASQRTRSSSSKARTSSRCRTSWRHRYLKCCARSHCKWDGATAPCTFR
ncbi:hypothetical protein, variant 1 [Aphanomyces invadans]|uniref:Histone-lysine N-methyltransferase, H3 lysine-79 specific n=1 Tax=Aphanomyces invadans TaxID=157072 RepID=A0A024U2W9_9STRA|nr:hypothetical protein, variant 1 [Aphanomyces invadans]ETW00570.1 hypothetical protein, variant 1 [Aphanomyces invadans]|eukprot:XP_008870705.1 hypothetical protein, variant 1 [Aphanomyces invadans]